MVLYLLLYTHCVFCLPWILVGGLWVTLRLAYAHTMHARTVIACILIHAKCLYLWFLWFKAFNKRNKKDINGLHFSHTHTQMTCMALNSSSSCEPLLDDQPFLSRQSNNFCLLQSHEMNFYRPHFSINQSSQYSSYLDSFNLSLNSQTIFNCITCNQDLKTVSLVWTFLFFVQKLQHCIRAKCGHGYNHTHTHKWKTTPIFLFLPGVTIITEPAN